MARNSTSFDPVIGISARRQRLFVGTIGLFLAMLLTGCGLFTPPSAPAQTEQTNLELLVRASSGLNPDPQGRPAPILMRIYELRASQVFQEADFFSLYNTDRATLGADILVVDQVILRPGETYSLRRKSNPQTKVIGVLAGYRDLPHATWRAMYLVPPAPEASWYRNWVPNQSVKLDIDLQPNAVLITDRLMSSPPVQPDDPREPAASQGNTVPPDMSKLPEPKTPSPSLLDQAKAVGQSAQDAGKTVNEATQALPDKSTLDAVSNPREGLSRLLDK